MRIRMGMRSKPRRETVEVSDGGDPILSVRPRPASSLYGVPNTDYLSLITCQAALF